MRLFIAIPLPAHAREALARLMDALRAAGARGRWVKPENIHLTLRFLGELPQSAQAALTAALDAAAGQHGAFELTFDTAGVFASREGQTLWVGARPSARLTGLYAALAREIGAAGFGRDERALKPHLTLARAADRNAQTLTRELLRPFAARCDTLTLYSSQLGPAGPRYTAVHEAALVQAERGQPQH